MKRDKLKKFLMFFPLIVFVTFVTWWIFEGFESRPVQSEKTAPLSSDQPMEIQEPKTVDTPIHSSKPANMKESEAVAKEFLKDYLYYDKNGTKLDQVKGLMTQRLYESERKKVIRPTSEMVGRRLVSINRSESEVVNDEVSWLFLAIIEITDSKGAKINEELVYRLSTIQVNGVWKVKGVEVDGSF